MIGYDAATCADLPLVAPEGLTIDEWSAATAEPRRYGFHATLKAPFRLAPGVSENDILHKLEQFAQEAWCLGEVSLVPRVLKSFIALTPESPVPELDALAARAVVAFEPFRAPLDSAEMKRRLESPLTPRQRDYLDVYGYPYVFEEFRFHMTLTGSLHCDFRESCLSAISSRLKWEFGSDVRALVDRVVLFRQESPADRFRIIHVATLR